MKIDIEYFEKNNEKSAAFATDISSSPPLLAIFYLYADLAIPFVIYKHILACTKLAAIEKKRVENSRKRKAVEG